MTWPIKYYLLQKKQTTYSEGISRKSLNISVNRFSSPDEEMFFPLQNLMGNSIFKFLITERMVTDKVFKRNVGSFVKLLGVVVDAELVIPAYNEGD